MHIRRRSKVQTDDVEKTDLLVQHVLYRSAGDTCSEVRGLHIVALGCIVNAPWVVTRAINLSPNLPLGSALRRTVAIASRSLRLARWAEWPVRPSRRWSVSVQSVANDHPLSRAGRRCALVSLLRSAARPGVSLKWKWTLWSIFFFI